jgi:AcrR family transcriptional regulator
MKVKRHYQSDLRREHAEATRRRIVDAASKLFREVGYEKATIAAIARTAQLAVQTLYGAFSSKEQIGFAVIERVVIESGIRSANAEALAATDPELAFRAVAAAVTRLYAAQSEIIDLLSLEFAATVRRTSDEFRLRNLRELMASSTFVPRLRPGLTPEGAALDAWTVAGIENYQRLVRESGWTRKRYERWLGDILIHLTLSEPRPRRR